MPTITLDLVGDYLGVLDGLTSLSSDMSDFFREVGQNLVQSTEERFRTAIDPDGRAWAPLAESTLRRKKKGRDSILVEEGYLAGNNSFEEDLLSVDIFNSMMYAGVHQFGATITRHAQSSLRGDPYLHFREIEVQRADGSTYKRKVFAKKRHATILNAARRWSGAAQITIPARPFLGLSEADKAMITRKVELYFGGYDD